MLSLVSQLFEHGIRFEQGSRQELLSDLPADLEAYKVVLFDGPAFDAVVSDGDSRRRLEAFAARPGFVFRVMDPTEDATKELHARITFDMVTRDLVQDIVMHAPPWQQQIHQPTFARTA